MPKASPNQYPSPTCIECGHDWLDFIERDISDNLLTERFRCQECKTIWDRNSRIVWESNELIQIGVTDND
jgi:hypothetical protein